MRGVCVRVYKNVFFFNLEIFVLLENTTVIEVCNIAERLAAESTTAARAAEHLAVK